MESKDSVRNRLRASAPEADDRALLAEQIALRRNASAGEVDFIEDDMPAPRPRRTSRPADNAFRGAMDLTLDTLVKAAQGFDATVNYVKAKPLTAVTFSAAVGAVVVKLLLLGRRR